MEDALLSIESAITAFTDRNEWIVLAEWKSPEGSQIKAYRVKAPYYGDYSNSHIRYIIFIATKVGNEAFRCLTATCIDETECLEIAATKLSQFKQEVARFEKDCLEAVMFPFKDPEG